MDKTPFLYISAVTHDATVPHGGTGLPVKALRVEVLEGPDRGQTKVTESETLSVGTAETNDLVLTDETVSRFHLDLLRQGGPLGQGGLEAVGREGNLEATQDAG